MPETAQSPWRWMDGFLSPELKRVPPEEMGRARLLIVITLVLMLFDGMILLFLPVSPQPWVHGPVILMSLAANGVALGLLRHRSTLDASATLVCATMAAMLVFTLSTSQWSASASHAAITLLPALSVYLIGPRAGLLITLPVALFIAVIHPLRFTLWGDLRGPEAVRLWMMNVSAAFCMGCLWVVSWLHSSARRKAHQAREQALRTLRESEHKLHTLIENTDDLVCSLDVEGRVLVVNSAMRKAYRIREGREPVPGEPLFPRGSAKLAALGRMMAQSFSGRGVRREDTFVHADGRHETVEVSFKPMFGEDSQPLGLTLFARNITERKVAEAKLSEVHRTLLDVSRKAGMAEAITGLLHNVGNTLNSVNVSVHLVTERLRASRVGGLARAVELLHAHRGSLAAFLERDPRGQQLPAYLVAVSSQLVEEQRALLAEQDTLAHALEHVKSIISTQQQHARVSAPVERVSVTQLIDDALRLHALPLERAGVEIRRQYDALPEVMLDRHKLLQIVLNLLSNARQALLDTPRSDKRLTVRIAARPEERLLIQVTDNGPGISREHLPRIFTQGFTTKKDGHGFGLHTSALAALEMDGTLTCDSPGPGQGATFTIDLPMQPPSAR
ncbi:two-component system sensor histidine kinase NtrB [Archangium primigenium]|uniref:two-component system sensor histidine kinase NtrB n=1 Tax=[Archangium] primigenium TaxID=2792470 RepID=UPI00195BAA12|nr:ATP-binding protein [Archangium primigenium]MBM7116173.1 PAS domain S-box protein [Archangium primigenium]